MFWTIVNIIIPVFLPYLVLGIVALDSLSTVVTPPAPPLWQTLLKKSVDTGQLFWTAISLLASTGYEIAETWDKHKDHDMAWVILSLCFLFGFICTSCVALCTYRAATGQPSSWWTISISILLTIAISITFPIVHFSLSKSATLGS